MPKVKIILDKDETIEEAQELLFKSLNYSRSGEAHEGDNFYDAAMADLHNQLTETYENMFSDLINEIIEELESEYKDGNI